MERDRHKPTPIAVVDYGMGNLGSVMNMFRRIGIAAVRTSDAKEIAKAAKLVLPGVGAFDRGMESIQKLGLRDVLTQKVTGERVPILGICLGMQLMCRESEEGVAAGLGWMDAKVVRFAFAPKPGEPSPKVPHMGWDYVTAPRPHPLLARLGGDARYYFVHSYHVVCSEPQDCLLASDYGGIRFTAAMARGNMVGVQFHPEKSHRFGIALFRSFVSWAPAAQPASA
jgi:glutamine amidotransferase